ncbi:tetratricopeptide repeat-containing protein [Pseudogemmobacter humi]|uniref:tetratricopeptide repeat-containing protein n=1 Tax=Pseudogemmobacter humi TaxID=2483812 RepID=UPI000F5247BF|nr:tetratricopeptide repeat-containing protein [Pseudogemmobacter humi]
MPADPRGGNAFGGEEPGASNCFSGIFHETRSAASLAGGQPRPAHTVCWRDCDLNWERLQERALGALRDGRPALAAWNWRLAWLVARMRFDRRDPRQAASLANLGLAARLAGRERLACRRYAAALRRWGTVPAWIDTMTIARRGRSSLFHLQSEALHWDAYERSLRSDAMRLARDVASRLNAASRSQPPPGRTGDRWPGEKPATFDDLRKFLGAALLIAADTPGPDDNQD